MAQATQAMAALGFVALAALAAALLWGRNWRHYRPEFGRREPAPTPGHRVGEPGAGPAGRVLRAPVTWYLAFVALGLGFGGAVLLGVGGDGLSVAGLVAGLLAVYLLVSVYYTSRRLGRSGARATAETLSVLGLLLVGVVVVQLLAAG